jgi:hypothetical protein
MNIKILNYVSRSDGPNCGITLAKLLQSLLMPLESSLTIVIMFMVQARVATAINYNCNVFIIVQANN